jgi:hypothetical protein
MEPTASRTATEPHLWTKLSSGFIAGRRVTPDPHRSFYRRVIARYLGMLDTADRQEDQVAEMRVNRLSDRLEALRRQMRELQAMERAVADAPNHQVSLTDPDARAMATNGKGTGIVGYNVQTAVNVEHHLIVAHEVTNVGHDRTQLVPMALRRDAPTAG